MSGRLRFRDIPALPFLFLLHLGFTLSSLFVRTYELLTNPETDLDHDELSTSGTGSPPRQAANSKPPKHVGLVIPTPKARGQDGHSFKWSAETRARMVECVLNFVELASEEEVREVSVYEASGKSRALHNG